jgi:hypothetical protein
MGGGTGNIRTLRNQSGTVGNRTFLSIVTSGNAGGAGSVRRMYAFYKKQNPDASPFTPIFGINKGQFASRAQWFIGAV